MMTVIQVNVPQPREHFCCQQTKGMSPSTKGPSSLQEIVMRTWQRKELLLGREDLNEKERIANRGHMDRNAEGMGKFGLAKSR